MRKTLPLQTSTFSISIKQMLWKLFDYLQRPLLLPDVASSSESHCSMMSILSIFFDHMDVLIADLNVEN